MTDLSVVIPVYNEAENIGALLEEVFAALAPLGDGEVIVVDDGSRDATAQRLAELQGAYDRLRVIRHEGNYGQSAAILTGVRAARAEWVVTLDGDGQNDPADIPRLIGQRDRYAGDGVLHMVTGFRRKREDNLVRRLSSRVANGVRGRLLRDGAPDTGCGLKLFRREAFLALPHFDHMHRFLPALFRRAGGTVLTVQVNHRPRRHGQSKYGLFDRLWVGIIDLLGVMWLQRRACRAGYTEVKR